jgi:broad specificity polyphosphatase/5'/3'-nucleotidase SurE
VSVPPDFGGLSVDSYLSGIVAGILEGAGFHARVTAHSVALEEGEASETPKREKAVFLVKFAQSVMDRDAALGS